jgi:hypothetical protein
MHREPHGRVPLRVHTFTGQVWATQTGFTRLLLKSLDRLLAACATHVLADSASQLAFLREQHVLRPGQVKCSPAARSAVWMQRVSGPTRRRGLWSASSWTFRMPLRCSFLSGGSNATRAWSISRRRSRGSLPRPTLISCWSGPDEEALTGTVRSAAGANLRLVGMTEAPERYMAAGDVFCLPSYREGFGAVIIEAAAAGLPAIGSRIYGITDAIGDGVTGILVAAADVEGLADAMRLLALDETEAAARLRTPHASVR